MTKKAPFRYDIVGSFLRPAVLKEARANAESGKITHDELKAVEKDAIADLVKKEKENGLHAFTDGEFPRSFWHLDFLASLKGAAVVSAKAWSVHFKGHQPKAETLRAVGKISFSDDNPFLEQFRYLQSFADADHIAKMTLPSPSMFHLITSVREENPVLPDFYANDEDLYFADITKAYQDALLAFYKEGCRYLQFDDTSWGEFCSAEKRKAYADRGIDVDAVARRYVKVLNNVLSVKPADMTVTMHICRGNFRSTWFSSGGYEPIANILFSHCRIDGFFLEYDSDRAGDFRPLRFIQDQNVVLGLITSKTPELEDKDTVKARIKEAARYVPLDQLCLSPQCGFASTEEGNILTEEEQWAKIRLIRDIAKEVWQDA